MTPHAPDEPPSGCLGDPAPFLLECIGELVDVLWLERTSPDTSPEDVAQIFDWRQVWGLRWPWESRDSAKLRVILDNTCTIGSCKCCLKKMTAFSCRTGVRPNDIVSIVEPSDIFLADVEFCPPNYSDPSPDHDISTSWSGRVRSWLEAGDAPQFDAKLFTAHYENRDFVNCVSWP